MFRLILPLIVLVDSSSTTSALSSHRPCFISRVSSPSRNTALSSASFGRRCTADNLHRLFLSSDSSGQQPTLTNIGKADMAEIISHAEKDTGDVNYVIIDVRGSDEIMMGTGVMSDIVNVLPLPEISSMRAFDLNAEAFEAQFNFPKPNVEDTLVFTCKAGLRSQQAAQLAAIAGYPTIINYEGGSDDWFGGELFYIGSSRSIAVATRELQR